MVKDIGRLIKQSGVFGVGTVLSKAVGFFMIPVYTRFLAPSDYGVLELLDLILFLAANLAGMGIYTAVFHFYAGAKSEEEKKEVISTALLASAAFFALCMLVMILSAGTISRLAFGTAALTRLVRIVSFTLFFSSLTEVPMAYWRARERVILFVCIGLARTLLAVLTLSFFLVVLKWGVEGAVYANLLTNGIAGALLFGVVLAQGPKKLDRTRLKELLAYGAPLVPWGINMFILTFSDRFFLRYYGNLGEVGIYALAYKLAMILAFLVNVPFSMMWQPQQFELAKRGDAKIVFAKVQTYLLVISVLVGLGIAVMAKDVLRILTPPSYWPAARLVPLILVSYVLSAVGLVEASGIYVRRVTRYLAPTGLFVAVANLLLNYVLISRYLAMGAAIATALSYACNVLLCHFIAQRVFPVRHAYERHGLILGWATLLYLVSTLNHFGVALSMTVNTIILFAFLVLPYMMFREDRREIFEYVALSLAQRFRSGEGRVEGKSR